MTQVSHRQVQSPTPRLAGVGLWVFLAAALICPAATLQVTTTNDSGAGSLRQAILDANATNGLDTITFKISSPSLFTISPAAALPAITDPVVIDGTTQPGHTTNHPLIELNGVSAGGSSVGLRLLAGNSTVRGLAIGRFGAEGIHVETGGSNFIQGNFIGTDVNGLLGRGNANGIVVNLSSGNVIGGTNPTDRNLISANGDTGVYLLGASSNVIQGNYIGTSAAGSFALGNGNNGIAVYGVSSPASGNLIGGATTGARNLLSGNNGSGIYLIGSGATGNVVQGNYIGSDAAGHLPVRNAGDGITLQGAANNAIGGTGAGEGNLLSGNTQSGVSFFVGAPSNQVQGNLIGTDASGQLALGNGASGVTLLSSSANVIGGATAAARNVISANKLAGVFFTNSAGNWVAGNLIGVDATGANALGNLHGISINAASSNTIGGLATGARNIISANTNDGIILFNAAASGNLIQGNFIGTAAGGTAGLGNSLAGVGLSDAPGNTIGGTAAGAGNLISANGDAGLFLVGIGASGNQIQGNLIGSDATGTLPLGNALEGIYVERAPTNTIGGAASGAANLISANHTRGIFLTNASWNLIQGNLIGTKADGLSSLGNSTHAVECEAGATNNAIGGAAGAGNRIAFSPSGFAGVRVRDGSLKNSILGNAVFSNGALGIDLGAAGVTANDSCDGDSGANMLQNFPVLTQAVSGKGTGIRGSLNSTAGGSLFLLQFFANSACDGSGNGEGQIYLGDKTVVTSNDCNVSFVATFNTSVPTGYVITSTATDAANNTSEFSACVTVAPVPALAITPRTNHQVNVSWTNSATGFVLKQTSSLSPPIQWTTVPNSPVLTNNQFVVTLPISSTNRFFLLSFE